MRFQFKNHTEHALDVRGVLGADVTPEQLRALNDVELVIYIRDALPPNALQAVELQDGDEQEDGA